MVGPTDMTTTLCPLGSTYMYRCPPQPTSTKKHTFYFGTRTVVRSYLDCRLLYHITQSPRGLHRPWPDLDVVSRIHGYIGNRNDRYRTLHTQWILFHFLTRRSDSQTIPPTSVFLLPSQTSVNAMASSHQSAAFYTAADGSHHRRTHHPTTTKNNTS